jgi:hypothetical protein
VDNVQIKRHLGRHGTGQRFGVIGAIVQKQDHSVRRLGLLMKRAETMTNVLRLVTRRDSHNDLGPGTLGKGKHDGPLHDK